MKANKVSIKVFSKYIDFVDIFLPNLVAKLSKYIIINNYAIKLIDDWQFSYSFIYNLGLIKLESLKTYIKNNLANNFIKPTKSLARASIFLNKKPNKSLKLCIDYHGFHNLIIKN